MAIIYIETDTESGRRTIARLQDLLVEAESTIEQLKDSMQDLNSTWDGPANETMNNRFAADHESMNAYCKTLNQIIEQMEQAQSCYEAGQNKVDSCIQDFNLEH